MDFQGIERAIKSIHQNARPEAFPGVIQEMQQDGLNVTEINAWLAGLTDEQLRTATGSLSFAGMRLQKDAPEGTGTMLTEIENLSF